MPKTNNPQILCCGEALIDLIPGGNSITPVSGGGAFNTAIALGRLEIPTGYFGALSTDKYGVQLGNDLAQSAVSTALCPRVDRPTTLAHVTLQNGHASYRFEDENSAGRLLAIGDLPPLPDTVSTLFFGGISLTSDPAATAYETLLTQNQTRVIMIDPNIRPAFISDKPAYRARLSRMFAMADMVKVSDEDLQWLAPRTPPEAMMQRFITNGCKLAILTKGAKGATAFSARHRVNITAPETTVVDSIGAGDTFNAGILSALFEAENLTKPALGSLSKSDLENTLATATRAAAITVSRQGANPPTKGELCGL